METSEQLKERYVDKLGSYPTYEEWKLSAWKK